MYNVGVQYLAVIVTAAQKVPMVILSVVFGYGKSHDSYAMLFLALYFAVDPKRLAQCTEWLLGWLLWIYRYTARF